jgi:plastocyanin
MRRLLYLVSMCLVAALVAAPAAWAQGETVTVGMEDNYFDRAEISVPAGTTVTWVQNGENPHTTTSYDGLWDSGMVAGGSGGSYSYTFEEPGTYEYFCAPHESQGMVGTVTVTEAAAADQAAPADDDTLPDSGGPALLLPVALALVALGAAGVVAVRRFAA